MRPKDPRRPWLLLWALPLLLWCAPSLAAQPLVSGIQFTGLKHIKVDLVRRWIFTQVGEAFSRKTLLADLRRLRKTGYFSKVSALLKTRKGLVTVIYQFVERKGRIQAVYFQGNTLYTGPQLKTQIYLRRGSFFRRDLLAQDARNIIRLYHSIGYFKVRVTVQGRWNGGQLILWFVVKEGKAANIRRVILRGNKSIPSAELLKLLHSQKPSVAGYFTGRGFFHPSFVTNDIFLMRSYYFNKGFLRTRIAQPKLEVSRDRKWVTMIYNIVEGPRFRYGKVEFVGDLLRPAKQLLGLFNYKKGAIVNGSQLFRVSQVRIKQLYQNQGYYYTRMQIVPRITADHKIHVQFYLIKGPRVRVERIEIVGHKETRDEVIRRKILLREGDLFHATRLLQSRIRLLSTGYFERTDPRLGIKVIARRGTTDERLVLRFVLKEKSTWLYNFGPSFLPVEGFILSGQLGKRNFLGNGQTLLGGGLLSLGGGAAPEALRLWRIFGYFIDPNLFDTHWFSSLSAYISHHDTSSAVNAGFIRDTFGGSVNFSYPVGSLFGSLPLFAGLRYRIERVTLSPAGNLAFQVPISGYHATRTTSSFRLRLRLSTRNRSIAPTKGYEIFGSYEHAAPYFGADYTLHRWELGGRLFLPLAWKTVLKLAFTSGWSFSPDANGVLPFERFPHDGSFFLVRGYFPFSIGPRRFVPRQSGAAFGRGALNWGGTKKIVFNIEYEIPIIRIPQLPISLTLFFDAGNIYDDHEHVFQDTQNTGLPFGLYTNIGFGIRWIVANVGVMRFEFGFPLSPRPGDAIPMFNFQVGEAF